MSERNMSRCYDFFGMPGSGKSTVSHAFAEALREKGEVVVEPSFNLDRMSGLKRQILKIIFACLYSIQNPSHIGKIQKLININGYCGIHEKISQYVNLAIRLRDVNKSIKHNSVTILDQGIYQASISLSQKHGTDVKKNLNEIKKMLSVEITPIYVDVCMEIVIQRLTERNTFLSRIDRENDPKKKQEMLWIVYNACESLVQDNIYRIDGADRLSEIIEILLNELEE